jgi:hypothetical protein
LSAGWRADAKNLYISDEADYDVDTGADDKCGDSRSDENDLTDGDDGDSGVDTGGHEDYVGGGAAARQYPTESRLKENRDLPRGQVKKAGRRPVERNNNGSENAEEYDGQANIKK